MTASMSAGAWPALMSFECACKYLSLEAGQFRQLAERWPILPVDLGNEVILWRRTDIDRLVKRLPTFTSVPSGTSPATVRLVPEAIDQIARAVVARLGPEAPSPRPSIAQLVSISHATAQLGIGKSTIWRMIDRCELVIRKIGRRTLITQQSLSSVIDGSALDATGTSGTG